MCKTNPDEYRYTCPHGHVTVQPLSNDPRGRNAAGIPAYRCRTCKKTYQGRPLDTLGE